MGCRYPLGELDHGWDLVRHRARVLLRVHALFFQEKGVTLKKGQSTTSDSSPTSPSHQPTHWCDLTHLYGTSLLPVLLYTGPLWDQSGAPHSRRVHNQRQSVSRYA